MRTGVFLRLAALFAVVASGCAQEEYPLALYEAQHPNLLGTDASVAASAGGDGSATSAGPRTCSQARATPLPARLVAISNEAVSTPSTVLVDDVFALFITVCGQCHGPTVINGGFQIASASQFQTTFTQDDLNHARSNGPNDTSLPAADRDPMPPFPPDGNGEPFSQRSPDDSDYKFVTLAGEWLAAGRPESFVPSQAPADAGTNATTEVGATGASQFLMRPALGDAMTNLGDCIPSPALVGIEQTKSAQLDAMFAAAKPAASGTTAQIVGLPNDLADTDFVTFDSAALAQYGVVAYAPGYPLWSDNAGKLRYVRVPRGQSIHFNKTTQQFEIPPNTRFYKTFMRQIVDTDGSIRWQKVETRLIVSRPAGVDVTGATTQTALFGSYVWNDDETDATLVDTALRDGLPWGDTISQVTTNQPLAKDVLGGQPSNAENALLRYEAVRHYAVPSSARCIECHEGSASQSFVLGFLPLQVKRRPVGVGGVIESTGPDELTQLQRLIDYGVITGIDSPDDIFPLESSEGARLPRNDYELVAQGYMLGNCSHCHNPLGAPSIENPVLTNLLNFLPGPDGGIFQFPLERYSPRILRGVTGTTPMPYITPSLVDQPRYDPTQPAGTSVLMEGVFEAPLGGGAINVVYAPWRSLIYRNTDTAFSYTDDIALFPHMPRNTPGYDPRAHQILSDWMVSIPAVRKRPDIAEYTWCIAQNCDLTRYLSQNYLNGEPDQTPQPYAEVLPGDPRYDDAVAQASARLSILHTGINPDLPLPSGITPYSRYSDPGDTGDILDPLTIQDPVCHPIPTPPPGTPWTLPPAHPQWTVTDLTEPEGPWQPRRPDWSNILMFGVADQGDSAFTCPQGGSSFDQGALADEQIAAIALQKVAIDPAFRTMATTKIPFGLWQQDPGCNFASQKTVQDFTGAARPHWFDQVPNISPSAPVYMETPGAGVFKMICINCHGPLADSNGRLADNLADMSGGLDIVADFRAGFMGPLGASADATDRHLVFGSENVASIISAGAPAAADAGAPWFSPQLTDWTQPQGPGEESYLADDDRAARYMAWMALGGTKKQIPQPILQIVGLTQVLGVKRPYLAFTASANMLAAAKAVCTTFLGPQGNDTADLVDPKAGAYGAIVGSHNPTVITSNGDAENWFNICSYNPVGGNHPSPVRILHVVPDRSQAGLPCSGPSGPGICDSQVSVGNIQGDDAANNVSLIDPATYPATAGVGTADGGVAASLTDDNEWPWCVVIDFDDAKGDAAAYVANNQFPICPAGTQSFTPPQANAWAVRAAINAGLAVFLYVEQLETQAAPDPDYDQCASLNAGDAGAP